MVKIQENATNNALFIQIPKAIVIAKGLKKGQELNFIIDDTGQIILNIKK